MVALLIALFILWPKSAPGTIKLDAGTFLQKYRANAKTADLQFATHSVELTGKVGDIEIPVRGAKKAPPPSLYFEAPERGFRVQCVFADPKPLQNITKGQAVTIKGLCQHQLGPSANVRIIGCQMVENARLASNRS